MTLGFKYYWVKAICSFLFSAILLTVSTQLLFANDGEEVKAAASNHLGVASCSASTCHGANVTFKDSNILRNEFRVWNESDPHARAYKTLLNSDSKKIAQNLRLGNAHESSLCLGCHANDVPVEVRGANFDIADGVSCEACHGGGESYLQIHTSGDHQANLDSGLYPTENPHARAKLCVSCHVGNDSDRKITHEIMGAGHPRLSFELNTFTSIQPAHYQIDQDYIERKGEITELQVWAIGQVVAARRFLANVESFPNSGLFPELVHMDCLGCHQEMSKVTWSENPLTNLPAGALRYNDAYLMSSYQVVKAVMPNRAATLLQSINSFLNIQNSKQGVVSRASKLDQVLAAIEADLLREPINTDHGLAVLTTLVDIGLRSSHRDYASAEQSAMAINSVLKVLDAENQLSLSKGDVVNGVNNLFNSLNDADAYSSARFVKGLKQVRKALGRLL